MFKPLHRYLFFISFSIVIGSILVNAVSADLPAQEDVVDQLENDNIMVLDDVINIEWKTDEPTLETKSDFIQIPSFTVTQEPNKPQVPQKSILIALDEGANPTIRVNRLKSTPLPFGPIKLVNGPLPSGTVTNSAGDVVGGAFISAEATDVDQVDPVSIIELGSMDGVRLARVTYSPVLFDKSGYASAYISDISITIDLDRQNRMRSQQQFPAQRQLHQQLKDIVANGDHIATMPPDRKEYRADLIPSQDGLDLIIQVDSFGMMTISFEDIEAVYPLIGEIDPAQLRLSHHGTPIAMTFRGDTDDLFEPGESISYVALPISNRWANYDTYRLTTSTEGNSATADQLELPVDEPLGQLTQEQLFEENLIYTPNCVCGSLPLGRDGDRWVWAELRRPGNDAWSQDFEMDLATIDLSQDADITVYLQGITTLSQNPDHAVQISINDVVLGDVIWDGKATISETLPIPSHTLQVSNTVNLTMVDNGVSVDGIWLDAFEISYTHSGEFDLRSPILVYGETTTSQYRLSHAAGGVPQVYNVTDPAAAMRVATDSDPGNQIGWRDPVGAETVQTYLITHDAEMAPASFSVGRQSENIDLAGGAYLIITPDQFRSALQPLVELRSEQGYTVVIESPETIYDLFGDGLPSPESIQSYLAWAYNNWGEQPEFVLLVGDGNQDPKQYLNTSQKTWIPPFLADVDPWLGETAADNRFVAIDGDDILPDMALGRLPVNSAAETAVVVSKIVAYEREPRAGNWRSDLLFVADNTDDAGNFGEHSDHLIDSYLDSSWSVKRVYFDQTDDQEDVANQKVEKALQNGVNTVMFTGHSSIHQWAVERLLHVDQVESLANGQRLPIILEMTCFTGSFHVAGDNTLDESLLRHDGGGAVATWGPTGLGVATGHEALARGYMGVIYNQNDATISAAILAGKIELMINQPGHFDLIDTFTLLGDPAMGVAASADRSILLPLVFN